MVFITSVFMCVRVEAEDNPESHPQADTPPFEL